METNQDTGIWGGLSEDERRNLRRQNAARIREQRSAVPNP
jgi:WhiB family redox-sensing transcriptional regulator